MSIYHKKYIWRKALIQPDPNIKTKPRINITLNIISLVYSGGGTTIKPPPSILK